jgi:hypothetical protein
MLAMGNVRRVLTTRARPNASCVPRLGASISGVRVT